MSEKKEKDGDGAVPSENDGSGENQGEGGDGAMDSAGGESAETDKEIPGDGVESYDTAVLILLTKDGRIMFSNDPPILKDRVMSFDEVYGLLARAMANIEYRNIIGQVQGVVQQALIELPKFILNEMQHPKKKGVDLWKPGG